MTSSTVLEGRPYPVTQHLIKKYQRFLLGQASNKDGTLAPGKKHDLELSLREIGINMKCHSSDDHFQGMSPSSNADDEQDESSGISLFSKCKIFAYQLFVGDYKKKLLIEKLMEEKQLAISYDEWCYYGLRLDELTDVTKWKQEMESNLYDYQLVRALTLKMRQARESEDYSQLLYTVRSTWVRNLGNMGNVNLYRHSHQGTKFLIDEYMMESQLALEALLSSSDFDESYLLGILQQTRRNIGRTALVLSGGGTFGLFHIGVLATLFELDLLPKVISGSSAGAIVASIVSVHHKDEIPQLLDRVLEMEFNIFKDDNEKSESENFLIKISRFLKNGTWFDNKHLVHTMVSFLGDLTFREAYNRTGRILNITVSPASLFEQPRLLNNLTAPNVLIWSAVCASCSLPGIFPSSPLYEKDPKTGEAREWGGSSSVKFVDGSVDNDLPISRLSEMFNVDHVIACQVNIHIFPFLKLSLSCVGGDIEDEFSARLKQSLSSVYNFMANEAIHALELGCEFAVAKNLLTKLRSVLSQQYSGDVTILPDMNQIFRVTELLANPSKGFLLRETVNGARATWPKVSIIKNHCGQEFALDKAIAFLKGKIIVSSSIKNPLQFADNIPCGLVKARNKKKGRNHRYDENNNQRLHELDDNLFESESIKSLLTMRENPSSYAYHVSGANHSLPIHASPTAVRHHPRRKSETNARTKHASKSLSPPISASLPHARRESTEGVFPPRTPSKPPRKGLSLDSRLYKSQNRIESAPISQHMEDSPPLSTSSAFRPNITRTTKSYPGLGDTNPDGDSEESSLETPQTPHASTGRRSVPGQKNTKRDLSWDGRIELVE
ncbi:hypothetical protein ZYGR_0AD03620 [Zygosaccharomyces rouxii]|uniref:Patatin-like phospholipase domain-containing protein n=2 Tax=Zygosaccharomyces rouxii TaxID=4956 RepID=C5E0P4_ZYGRC|nr:uncharacterized protein ZYRO0G14520g [Zygosaccharomyces rouxii]KAH9202672.1 acyl transferase/acyl hydrolase/lysophospholipase [Zygosaccharomyces rouxii]GAV51179.1 hypothetical protein ZYGR_0AD03620 [Zygosaccharomyces rouxii]CAR29678.1 ZYRO0G14520p [Zygosaccharomyces rouxii]